MTAPTPGVADPPLDGTWDCSLLWIGLPDHTSDQLNLTFELPPGWSWKGPPPPAAYPLDHDVRGSWVLHVGR